MSHGSAVCLQGIAGPVQVALVAHASAATVDAARRAVVAAYRLPRQSFTRAVDSADCSVVVAERVGSPAAEDECVGSCGSC